MIAAIQLLEYLHYHITPRTYVTLYNVNTWYRMLENKPIYPPKKMSQKETCFLQQIPACTIRGFNYWFFLKKQVSTGEGQTEPLVLEFSWRTEPERENNRQTISNDCLWHYFSENEIFLKGEETEVHLIPNHFCIYCMCTRLPLLGCWTNHTKVYLCAEKTWYSLFWTEKQTNPPLPKKKHTKLSVGTMISWIKINLSSIQWEFWTASDTTNVTYNINVHWFHNIKNQRWSVIGLPMCAPQCVRPRMMLRECVCDRVCYWENASSFISMRGLSWLSMRRLGPIMLLLCLNDLDLLGEFGFLSDFLFLAFFSAP